MPALKKIGAAALSAFGFTGETGLTGQILVIAGGGAGGAAAGQTVAGGGGAGGLCYHAGKALDATATYTVVIGAGAAGGATGATQGPSGSNSSFDTIIALGGGGGGAGYAATQGAANGVAGGSGGGGGSLTTSSTGTGGSSTQGTSGGATGYGFAGGSGNHVAGTNVAGGGGGGAGGVGGNGNGSTGAAGAGGVGLSTWSAWGAATSTGENVSGTYYYAGGGGGGSGNGVNTAGGYGGGAYGGKAGDATQAPNAQANTGGGGGGGPVYTGAGGSGLVIVRYQGSQKFVGGVVTTDGTYIYHTFTTSGSLVPITTPITANYLIVAGGGGGGRGAGAGAGGFQASTTTLSLSSTYTVVVGAGGVGATPATGWESSTSGTDSSFTGLPTSIGGGRGIGGGSGGVSGGSGSGCSNNASGQTPGSGTTGQGNSGGNSGAGWGGGGGGGAGAAGGNGTGTTTAGAGGTGNASSITGTSVYYAGGGGGSGFDTCNGAAGGNGGGGAGGNSGTSVGGVNGTVNTGGGGGAGHQTNQSTSGGAGGSGIVVISYAGSQLFGGGVVTTNAGNTIHTFYTSGTLSPLSTLLANYLIVAGGGGSGSNYGGGAGAGGLLSGSNVTIDTNSIYVVTVGAGGAGTSYTGNGNNGTNSSFSSITTIAVGGGAGPSYPNSGVAGGSGGGASNYSVPGGAGVAGQGFKGGNSTTGYLAAGGGGAAQAGGDGQSGVAGYGGNGAVSSISGTATYYAGGGGGGYAGVGGLGGGGNGSNTSGANGNPGSANTGGGAGGGGGAASGANGGSGIVIIAYPGSTQRMAGGNVTVVSNTVVHTFTSSGYLTPITNFGNSLRFRSSGSTSLTRTPTVASNLTTWTWSAWIKRGTLSVYQEVFAAGPATNNSHHVYFYDYNAIGFEFYNVTYDYYVASNAVFRDPAAWYHVVAVWDTTQATAANRMRLYVNGVLINTNAATSYPTQNLNGFVNTVTAHALGKAQQSAASYYDGEMTNINFIDGQALEPTAFGAFNSYGVWQPITYGGSYGTNGFYLPFNVDRSQYSYAFNTTPSYLTSTTAGIMPLGNTTWSIEFWCWFNAVPSSNMSFIANTASGGVQIFYRPAINTVEIGAYGAADVLAASWSVNNQILNAWNHFVFTSNGSQLRIFFNGNMIGYAASSYSFAASQSTVYIGTNDTTSSGTLNGFISNLRVCNGSIPTTYQTSATTIYSQVFSPPTTALTTTSQGAANVSLLTCQSSTIVDNSPSPKTLSMTGTVTPSTIGPSSNPFYDRSPQGNNWTPNNISLVNGSTCDSLTDVPTLSNATSANYCVLNPLDVISAGGTGISTITNGNLQAARGAADGHAHGTLFVTSGKYYFEVTVIANHVNNWAGVSATNQTTYATYRVYEQTGQYFNGTAWAAYGASYTTGDVIGVALDMDNQTIEFYKNNVSQGQKTSIGLSGYAIGPVLGTINGGTQAINCGQQPWKYTPPTGYVALNTYNM